MAATIVDSYSETNQDSGRDLFSGSTVRCGQSFTPSFTGRLELAKFYLKKTGSPTGNINSRIYVMMTNLGGNDDVPLNTSGINSSLSVSASSLTTSYQLINFNYSEDDKFILVKGINFIVSVEYNGGDASNFVTVGYDASSPTHTGNQVIFTSSWSATAVDTCFYLYAEQLSNYGMNKGFATGIKVGDGMGKSG